MDQKLSSTKTSGITKGRISARIKTDVDSNPENIQQYITILSEHQKLFEKNGKFMEAERTKAKGLKLKAELEDKFLQDMRGDHAKQTAEIDQAHKLEMHSFNELRHQRMEQYISEAKTKEEEMLKRHTVDLVDNKIIQAKHEEEMEKTSPVKVKESPDLINLRRILEILAKQQNYVEAHKVQLKIQALEKEENPKFAIDRNKKISNSVYQLGLKHEGELQALRQKLKLGLDQKKKMFSTEAATLRQKYENTRIELEYNHKLQLRSFEKERKLHKNKLTLSKSYMAK